MFSCFDILIRKQFSQKLRYFLAFEICLENWKCSTLNSYHSNCLTCHQKFSQRFIYVPIEFYLLCYENNSILMDIVCNKTYSFKISATVQNTASKGDKFYLVLQETVGDGIRQLYFCGHLIKWNKFLCVKLFSFNIQYNLKI